MWYDDLEPGKPWAALWYGLIICRCGGIRTVEEGACLACGRLLADYPSDTFRMPDGREVTSRTYPGAEGRFEDYMYLDMLEREWKRPLPEADRVRASDPARHPSPRAAIIVQFWSYFETRIERLLRAGMRNLPPRVTEDLLQRYSAVGARLDRLYRILFDSTYRADLAELGFEAVGHHLARVQDRRNAFAHGDPHAIEDALVTAVVENLKIEHEAWIAAFNRRVVRI